MLRIRCKQVSSLRGPEGRGNLSKMIVKKPYSKTRCEDNKQNRHLASGYRLPLLARKRPGCSEHPVRFLSSAEGAYRKAGPRLSLHPERPFDTASLRQAQDGTASLRPTQEPLSAQLCCERRNGGFFLSNHWLRPSRARDDEEGTLHVSSEESNRAHSLGQH